MIGLHGRGRCDAGSLPELSKHCDNNWMLFVNRGALNNSCSILHIQVSDKVLELPFFSEGSINGN